MVLENNKPITKALVIPRGLGPVVPTATVARLPFAYSTYRYSDATNVWTFGDALNVGITNAYSPISGTHQPYGWDQMAALYRFYKVIGFKYKATAIITGQAANSPAVALGVRPVPVNENAALTASALATALERPGTSVSYTQYGGRPTIQQGSVDIPNLMGVTNEQFTADVSQYAALCTAAPSRYPYLQVAICGPETGGSPTYAYVSIECEYVVHFWQRITQSQS